MAQVTPHSEQVGRSIERHSYVPPNGFVPTAAVATRIAEAVLTGIYGEQQVLRQLPLQAELHGDVWIIQGTLPLGARGGVAEIEMSKADGTILRLSHGR